MRKCIGGVFNIVSKGAKANHNRIDAIYIKITQARAKHEYATAI